MAAAPSFGTSSTDEGAAPPWYKNKTFLIVGGLGLAALVFYYFYSQQSATGSGSTVTTTPSTGDASSTDSNVLSTLDTLSANDASIETALQTLQGSSGTNGTTGNGDTTGTVGGISNVVETPLTSYQGYSYQGYIFPTGTTGQAAATAIYGSSSAAESVLQHYNEGTIQNATSDVGGEVVYVPSAPQAPVLGGAAGSGVAPA